jgi:hypothetical protein
MTRLLTCGYETGDVAEAGVSTIGAQSDHRREYCPDAWPVPIACGAARPRWLDYQHNVQVIYLAVAKDRHVGAFRGLYSSGCDHR